MDDKLLTSIAEDIDKYLPYVSDFTASGMTPRQMAEKLVKRVRAHDMVSGDGSAKKPNADKTEAYYANLIAARIQADLVERFGCGLTTAYAVARLYAEWAGRTSGRAAPTW